MAGVLRQLGSATAVLGFVILAVSLGTATGAFTTTDVNRPADIRLGSGDAALVGLDVADEVSVACSERLVTVTNNFDHEVGFTVTVDEHRDGGLFLSGDVPGSSVSFTLTPGASQDVYVTHVRGPIGDDVAFEVSATAAATDVTLSRTVPKVPGNEHEDDGDGNNGEAGCNEHAAGTGGEQPAD